LIKDNTGRVWAPHAEKVYVIGSFNDWSETSIPLFNEKNGYWSADVSEAKVRDEYRYLIHGPESSFQQILIRSFVKTPMILITWLIKRVYENAYVSLLMTPLVSVSDY